LWTQKHQHIPWTIASRKVCGWSNENDHFRVGYCKGERIYTTVRCFDSWQAQPDNQTHLSHQWNWLTWFKRNVTLTRWAAQGQPSLERSEDCRDWWTVVRILRGCGVKSLQA